MIENKVIIGKEEWCSFPGLGIPAIKARIDSGAKTTALHAINIRPFETSDGEWVSFDINPLSNNETILISCKAPVIDYRTVKNSFGQSETRYVIKATIALGQFLWDTEVSLTNRDNMEYRMLLGRNAMQDFVLVDPAKGCYFGDKTSRELKKLYAEHTSKTPSSQGSPHA